MAVARNGVGARVAGGADPVPAGPRDVRDPDADVVRYLARARRQRVRRRGDRIDESVP